MGVGFGEISTSTHQQAGVVFVRIDFSAFFPFDERKRLEGRGDERAH